MPRRIATLLSIFLVFGAHAAAQNEGAFRFSFAERQDGFAALADVAERYARVRASVILLDWALDRYRKERQDPMLRRAGEIFRSLTGGSFARLEVGFDSKDRMQLNAVRPDGKSAPVSGLSGGTEDQLFLALRVAGVEEYVSRAAPLPFVADDLFRELRQRARRRRPRDSRPAG